MKKALSILVVFAVVFSFITLPVSAAYTDSTYFDGIWEARYTTGSSHIAVVTTETVAEGAPESDPGESQALNGLQIDGHAMRLSAYKNEEIFFRTRVAVVPGRKYRLTGKIRTGRSVNDQTYLLLNSNVWSKNTSDAYRIASLNTVAGAARTWKDVDYTFTVPSDVGTTYTYLCFYTINWGSILLDNLSLKEVMVDGNGDDLVDESGNVCYSEELIRNGSFEEPDTVAGRYSLEGIKGWTSSFWNIPVDGYEAGINLLTKTMGKYVRSGTAYSVPIPEGNSMMKVWQGDKGDEGNFNSNLRQQINLDTSKTYLLTGKVWISSNQTYLQLFNTDFNSGNGKDLMDYFSNNRDRWEDLSVEFTPTSSAVELKFYTSKKERKIYVDDLSVKEIEKNVSGDIVAYGEELLVNGNFEDNVSVPTVAGRYYLEDVAGWGSSFWNLPEDGYEAGIEVLENYAGAPEGSNVLKIWTGRSGTAANFNSNAIQKLDLDKSKRYRLTGKVKFSNNETSIKLLNTDFNVVDGVNKAKSLMTLFDNGSNVWQDLSIDFSPTLNIIELQFSTTYQGRTIYVDNLAVKEILYDEHDTEIGLGTVNHIVNGTFEGESEPVFNILRIFYPSDDGENILETIPQSSLSDMVDEFGVDYLCAQALFTNTKYPSKDVNVFLATYNNGYLEDVILTKADIVRSNEDQEVNIFSRLPDLSEGIYTFRLLVWDSENGALCRDNAIFE